MKREILKGEAGEFKSRRFGIPFARVHTDQKKKIKNSCRGEKHRHQDS